MKCCGIYIASVAMAAQVQQPSFEEWLSEYGMNVADDSIRAKYEHNVRIIDGLNAKDPSATYAVNRFSGMTHEEFAAVYLTLKTSPAAATDLPLLSTSSSASVDDQVDWDVTPVKDQGQCGSCWTFGVMGAIEGMNKVQMGNSVILSEQQLVDCDNDGINDGCNGGLTDYALKFLTGKDLYTLDSYPYVSGQSGHANSCQSGTPSGVTISGYFTVDGAGSGSKGDAALAAALMNGPVTVTVAADDQFANYHSGIMTGVPSSCTLNHAILATGYGPNFWKIKNSWGSSWGDQGYAKFERTTAGCGPFGLFFQDAGFQPTLGEGPSPSPVPLPSPLPPSPTPSPVPVPPAPTPSPSPSGHHYGGPPCQNDEIELGLSGYPLSVCTKKCGTTSDCPRDLPDGAAAVPVCQGDIFYCVLQCSSDGDCGEGGSCKYQECWYPSSGSAAISV